VTGGPVPQTPRSVPSAVPEMHQIPRNLTTDRISRGHLSMNTNSSHTGRLSNTYNSFIILFTIHFYSLFLSFNTRQWHGTEVSFDKFYLLKKIANQIFKVD
jgi:hypothetical protein